MRSLGYFRILAVLLLLYSCDDNQKTVDINEYREFHHELKAYRQCNSLMSSPPKENFGEVESIKFIYNFITDSIYFFDTKLYPNHYLFAKEHLGEKKSSKYFFWDHYGTSKNRLYYLGNINYYRKWTNMSSISQPSI